MFERRQLLRDIHIDSKFLSRNITASLLSQIRHRYEGICVPEGYIQKDSVTIVDYSLGRMNLIKGGLDYSVRFQADLCMPHPGQIFRGPVTLKSKIGVHIDNMPMKVLLPRDLHIGNGDFEDIREKQEVEFEVVGSKFQPRDTEIVVLGKMRTIIRPAAEEAPASDERAGAEPVLAAPVPGSSEQVTKKVTVDVASAKPADQAPRRRRLRPSEGSNTNEQSAKGSSEGKD